MLQFVKACISQVIPLKRASPTPSLSHSPILPRGTRGWGTRRQPLWQAVLPTVCSESRLRALHQPLAWPPRSPWPAAVCVWDCWSCRLWLSTEMPLSLWSFSPSGGGVWFTGRLLAPCLFCLQLFHLEPEDRPGLGVRYTWLRYLCSAVWGPGAW